MVSEDTILKTASF